MQSFSQFITELSIRRPESKMTLGVPRASMPQIEKEDYQELYRYLKDHGIIYKKITVDPAELKAIQRDFKGEGVVKALQKAKIKKSIIISDDFYVIDGNHRWLAALNTRAKKIDAIQFNTNSIKLLTLIKRFQKTTFKGLYD